MISDQDLIKYFTEKSKIQNYMDKKGVIRFKKPVKFISESSTDLGQSINIKQIYQPIIQQITKELQTFGYEDVKTLKMGYGCEGFIFLVRITKQKQTRVIVKAILKTSSQVNELEHLNELSGSGVFKDGNMHYMSPESFQSFISQAPSATRKSEAYSFGLILYRMVSSDEAISQVFNQKLLHQQNQNPIDTYILDQNVKQDQNFIDLIINLSKQQPKLRLSVYDAYQTLNKMFDQYQLKHYSETLRGDISTIATKYSSQLNFCPIYKLKNELIPIVYDQALFLEQLKAIQNDLNKYEDDIFYEQIDEEIEEDIQMFNFLDILELQKPSKQEKNQINHKNKETTSQMKQSLTSNSKQFSVAKNNYMIGDENIDISNHQEFTSKSPLKKNVQTIKNQANSNNNIKYLVDQKEKQDQFNGHNSFFKAIESSQNPKKIQCQSTQQFNIKKQNYIECDDVKLDFYEQNNQSNIFSLKNNSSTKNKDSKQAFQYQNYNNQNTSFSSLVEEVEEIKDHYNQHKSKQNKVSDHSQNSKSQYIKPRKNSFIGNNQNISNEYNHSTKNKRPASSTNHTNKFFENTQSNNYFDNQKLKVNLYNKNEIDFCTNQNKQKEKCQNNNKYCQTHTINSFSDIEEQIKDKEDQVSINILNETTESFDQSLSNSSYKDFLTQTYNSLSQTQKFSINMNQNKTKEQNLNHHQKTYSVEKNQKSNQFDSNDQSKANNETLTVQNSPKKKINFISKNKQSIQENKTKKPNNSIHQKQLDDYINILYDPLFFKANLLKPRLYSHEQKKDFLLQINDQLRRSEIKLKFTDFDTQISFDWNKNGNDYWGYCKKQKYPKKAWFNGEYCFEYIGEYYYLRSNKILPFTYFFPDQAKGHVDLEKFPQSQFSNAKFTNVDKIISSIYDFFDIVRTKDLYLRDFEKQKRQILFQMIQHRDSLLSEN
ncbi:hypothetical protein ABPG74_018487 [Tetrahymena malaccensis]